MSVTQITLFIYQLLYQEIPINFSSHKLNYIYLCIRFVYVVGVHAFCLGGRFVQFGTNCPYKDQHKTCVPGCKSVQYVY